jgi:hypothetical protein
VGGASVFRTRVIRTEIAVFIQKNKTGAAKGGYHKKESRYDQKRGPFLMTNLGGEEPRQHAREEPPERQRPARERFWDFKASHWVEVVLTLALVVVGALQYSVYNRQARIMETQTDISGRQLTDSETSAKDSFEQTKAAVQAAIDAASAATKQARIAEDTERRQLRPYVNIATGTLYNASVDGSAPVWHVPLIVENNGPTQTRSGTNEVWCISSPFSTDDPMKFLSSGKFKRFFGPKQSGRSGSCGYSPEIIAGAASNSYYLFIASKFVYYDNIDVTTPHITEFCVRLSNFRGDFHKSEGGQMDTNICDVHNCADEECPKEDLQ